MARKTPEPNTKYRCHCGREFLGSEFTQTEDYTGSSGWSASRWRGPCGHANYLGNFAKLK